MSRVRSIAGRLALVAALPAAWLLWELRPEIVEPFGALGIRAERMTCFAFVDGRYQRWGCDRAVPPTPTIAPADFDGTTGTIVAWWDGDSIEVDIGRPTTIDVQLRGVDAPEIEQRRGRGTCFDPVLGEQADGYAESLAPVGSTVQLVDTDGEHYGATTARVIADGVDVGAALLELGLARLPGAECLS